MNRLPNSISTKWKLLSLPSYTLISSLMVPVDQFVFLCLTIWLYHFVLMFLKNFKLTEVCVNGNNHYQPDHKPGRLCLPGFRDLALATFFFYKNFDVFILEAWLARLQRSRKLGWKFSPVQPGWPGRNVFGKIASLSHRGDQNGVMFTLACMCFNFRTNFSNVNVCVSTSGPGFSKAG